MAEKGLYCQWWWWWWWWWLGLKSHLSVYLSIYLSIHPSIHPSIYLSIYWRSQCGARFMAHPLHTYIHTSIYLSIYGPFLHLGRFFSFLILYTDGRILGRGISPPQGRYLHTWQHKHRINADKHPWLECGLNPWSQCSSERRQFMP
jgi:hypothetical protein